jgi:putative membrane protein
MVPPTQIADLRVASMAMVIAHAFATESMGLPVALASALAVVALVYGNGWFHLRRFVPQIASPWRPSAFLGGMLALWVAVGSPLAAYDEELLSVHMVQHLLLSAVAAPLLLLGAPAVPLLHGMPWIVLRGLATLLRWPPAHALGRMLVRPVVCWSLAMAVFIGWHTPAIFDLALRSARWHAVEHASFLASGLLFWWPVVQPWPSRATWPRWSIPLYLFLATLPCDALSAFLAFSDRVVYPAYFSAPRHFGLSALQDQEGAGALMWLSVTIAYVIPAAVITIKVLSPERAHSFRSSRDKVRAIGMPARDGDEVA